MKTLSLEELQKQYPGNVVYYYAPTKKEQQIYEEENMAKAYCVVREIEANEGLIVFADYGRGFESNPWSTRSLIRKLLEEKGIDFKLL